MTASVATDPEAIAGALEPYISGSQASIALLLHELTHVWQYQNGLYTVSQMLSVQMLAIISGTDIYPFIITDASKFENYTMEQQAAIVQACAQGSAIACALVSNSKYFKDKNKKDKNKSSSTAPRPSGAMGTPVATTPFKFFKKGIIIVEDVDDSNE